jgi:hypothetical protein
VDKLFIAFYSMTAGKTHAGKKTQAQKIQQPKIQNKYFLEKNKIDFLFFCEWSQT